MTDLKDKIEKLSFQAQTTPLVATCDTRLLFEVLNEAEEQEKENELLKKIIRTFFEDGHPLFQYTNTEGTLVIEVSGAMPIFNLGNYKGVDLDKFLEKVIVNE